MSNSNGQQKGIDGSSIALVLMTLGGVGGYLWLDHKLRAEKKLTGELTSDLLKLAALQTPPVSFPALAAAEKAASEATPPGAARPALPPGSSSAPTRNATSLARVPRIELAPRTYDDVFELNGRGLPVAYLRALALHESDMRARLADGPAWGLMQVIEVVREDFNRRERKNFSRGDLLNPAVSVTIAASALALIAKSYATNHPHVPSLQTNWRDPQFVALLTFGWNAGWSERGGVGRVVSFLEQRGADVNINAVFDASKAAGASPHLRDPAKLAFAKQVTRQYFAELADEDRVIEIEGRPRSPTSDRPAVVVEAPSSPSAPPMHPTSAPPMHPMDAHDDAHESPVFVVEPAIPDYVPMSVYGVPDRAPAPLPTAPQSEHELAPPGVVSVPSEGAVASAVAPPAGAPPIVEQPANAVIAMEPSGGDGPIDPYGPYDEPALYGDPEDPYAYRYAVEDAPHA